MNLHPYQQAAVNAILSAVEREQRIINVEMAPGTGKVAIISSLIKHLHADLMHSILILTSQQLLLEQISLSLQNADIVFEVDNKRMAAVLLTTYSKFQKDSKQKEETQYFSYIICFDTEDTRNVDLERIEYSKLIGFSALQKDSKGWFQNVTPVFHYSPEDAIRDGYLAELDTPQKYGSAVEGFCYRLFINMGFEAPYISAIREQPYPDLILSSSTDLIFIEVKTYRKKTFLLPISIVQFRKCSSSKALLISYRDSVITVIIALLFLE